MLAESEGNDRRGDCREEMVNLSYGFGMYLAARIVPYATRFPVSCTIVDDYHLGDSVIGSI